MITKDFLKSVQMTRVGSYEVCVPINLMLDKIQEWVEEGLQLQPDFQRNHVWSQDQQSKFIEYLLKGGITTPLYFNHPNWMGSFKGDFVLVDGLQRLTAILKFLKNELTVFDNQYLKDFEDERFINEIYIKINVNNLKTRKEVLKWYLDINSGGVVHTEEELEKVRDLLRKENI